MDKWWEQPLRAVTLEFPASDVATIDVAGIVDELQQGSVNTICVFSIGYYPGGTAFYQSQIAPHYPGLGERDLLAEVIEAARPNNQKVIAYVASIWGNAQLFEIHPDWAQRKANGLVTSWDEVHTSVAMCPNSPYREYLASVVQEIANNYDVDGFYFDEPSFQSWCNCGYCQQKFQSEHHHALPTEENWDDPIFRQFIAWRYEQISDWRQDLYELAKQEDRCVFFQGAFPFASLPSGSVKFSGVEYPHPYRERFGVSWYVPLAHAADLRRSAEIGDLVHFELYRRSVREPLWWYGASLRYGQAISQSNQVLTLNMMAQSPFDIYGLPEAELRLSIAEILANNGAPLFARYYPDRVDQNAWSHVYACLEEAEALEPYLTERKSIKYAAILFSRSSLERFDQVAAKPAHLGAVKGFAKALLQEHILFDIITESDIVEGLNGYKVLILPNTSCLSADAKQAIRAFVANGGGLVASHETGMYNEKGLRTSQDDFSELFGLVYNEQLPDPEGLGVYMVMQSGHELPVDIPSGKLIPTGGLQVNTAPADAEPVAQVVGGAQVMYGQLGGESDLPAILKHQSPEGGRVMYFAPTVGNRYLEFGVEDHFKLITAAVNWAADDAAPVRLVNAPQTIAMTAFNQPNQDRTIVHLVNSVRDDLLIPINRVPQSRDLRLELDVADPPTKVVAPGGQTDVSWSMENGILTITLPELQHYAVLVIDTLTRSE